MKNTVFYTAFVDIYSVGFFGVKNGELRIADEDFTGVADLAAALAVAYGFVEDYGAFALGDLIDGCAVGNDCNDACITLIRCVADKFGGLNVFKKRLSERCFGDRRNNGILPASASCARRP